MKQLQEIFDEPMPIVRKLIKLAEDLEAEGQTSIQAGSFALGQDKLEIAKRVRAVMEL